jgi:hypothetical protein
LYKFFADPINRVRYPYERLWVKILWYPNGSYPFLKLDDKTAKRVEDIGLQTYRKDFQSLPLEVLPLVKTILGAK